MHNLKAAILDEATFNANDLNMQPLLDLVKHWHRYPSTTLEQRTKHLEGITIAVANKTVFDKALLESLPELKVILLTATGMDNIDKDVCKQQGITTYNVIDYCTASVSQHVFTLILALSTNLLAYQNMTKTGGWSGHANFTSLQFSIQELEGKTLGLIGYGALAKGVEKLAKAFGMKILIAQRTGSKLADEGRLLLEDLLPQVDVLSIHCPLIPATKHLINAKTLQQMKPHALLINTARGAVVDNVALANALRHNVIGGAGIDVLEIEPPPADHPLIANDLPNLILTPHIAWASVEARQRVINNVVTHLKSWLNSDDNT
ncbi:MAG: glycerate dehydrogenase [Thiotrichaceae bacterium]|nr:glycerate dehydrogenase [Thiotrichaceae bacterium]